MSGMMYLIICYILCVAYVHAWPLQRVSLMTLLYDQGQADDRSHRNFSGLYFANSSFLCGADELRRTNLQNINDSLVAYSFDDPNSKMWLRYLSIQMNECVNETYKQLGLRIMPKIIHLDMSHSGFNQLRNFTFVNFGNLRILNLSSNTIRQLPSSAFSNLSSLEILDLSSNYLTSIDISYFPLSLTASASNKLSYLNISGNSLYDIKCLDSFEFTEWDYFRNWTRNNSYLSRNTTIDLSNNNIVSIPPSCREVFTKYYKNITIIINGNPVVCNCSTEYDSTSGRIINYLPDDCICQDEKKQHNYLYDVLFYSSILVFVLFGVLSVAFLFNSKYKRKTGVSSASMCSGTYCTNVIKCITKDVPKVKEVRTFVYIVASPKDSNILDTFVKELETKRNIPVIFKERDEIPGYFKLELFRKWLSLSKRTIFLISSNFFGDIDCISILTQAKAVEHTERRVIIVAIRIADNLHPQQVLSLNNLCEHSFCLDYNPSSVIKKEFWDKLAHIIENTEMHVHISNM